mmetsp:Transcript_42596/g.113091  ORF Transcript_42596/g.113091 Transcript_42596/m.113091 type:complete len:275 (+) Transcript_42596:1029-1853(+)
MHHEVERVVVLGRGAEHRIVGIGEVARGGLPCKGLPVPGREGVIRNVSNGAQQVLHHVRGGRVLEPRVLLDALPAGLPHGDGVGPHAFAQGRRCAAQLSVVKLAQGLDAAKGLEAVHQRAAPDAPRHSRRRCLGHLLAGASVGQLLPELPAFGRGLPAVHRLPYVDPCVESFLIDHLHELTLARVGLDVRDGVRHGETPPNRAHESEGLGDVERPLLCLVGTVVLVGLRVMDYDLLECFGRGDSSVLLQGDDKLLPDFERVGEHLKLPDRLVDL